MPKLGRCFFKEIVTHEGFNRHCFNIISVKGSIHFMMLLLVFFSTEYQLHKMFVWKGVSGTRAQGDVCLFLEAVISARWNSWVGKDSDFLQNYWEQSDEKTLQFIMNKQHLKDLMCRHRRLSLASRHCILLCSKF